MKLKSVILGLLVATTLFLAGKSATAGVDYRTYPNLASGPWHMEINTHKIDPLNGSKWAFGFINVCAVPFLSVSTYYGSSMSTMFLPQPYMGTTGLSTYLSTGSFVNIGNRSFSYWRPPGQGGSMSLYIPAGQYPQYVTVSAGTGSATAVGSMTDVSQAYWGKQVSVTEQGTYTCCEGGAGCP